MARAFAPVHETPLRGAAFDDPIEYLKFEHFRQLVLCELLGQIADDPYGPETRRRVPWVRRYLMDELALHTADEEEDLLPLLERRCRGADALDDIRDMVQDAHVSEDELGTSVVVGLTTLAAGRALERPLDFIVDALAFEEHLRRHLMWENLTLIPLARRRLTTDDLAALGRAMARRHARSAPTYPVHLS